MLVGMTLGLLVICLLMVWPFLSALTWSVTVAVATNRVWCWLCSKVGSRGVAAAIAVTGVALTVLLPILWLGYLATSQIVTTVQDWEEEPLATQLSETLADYPRLEGLWNRVSESVDVTDVVQQTGQQVQSISTVIVSGIAYTIFQAGLMLFILFFLYRDQDQVLEAIRRYAPLNEEDTECVLTRVSDTIHATVLGFVVIALVQGVLGGLIFWFLGLPGAALWASLWDC